MKFIEDCGNHRRESLSPADAFGNCPVGCREITGRKNKKKTYKNYHNGPWKQKHGPGAQKHSLSLALCSLLCVCEKHSPSGQKNEKEIF